MSSESRVCLLGAFILSSGTCLRADTVIDFEWLSDGTFVSSQYSGLEVLVSGNPTIFTIGSPLNEIEFPASSRN
jgi:hypothetical protein